LEIKHILGLVSIVIFLLGLFLSKSPFIDLNITNEQFGSISVFDFVSFFILTTSARNYFKPTIQFSLFSLLFILLFIGSVKSEFIQNSLFNFIKLFSVFIYCKILIQECLKDRDFIEVIIKYLKISCILSLVFLFIQLLVGPSFSFYPDLNPNVYIVSEATRYPSYFQDPQKYAQYLSMISFIFLLNKGKKPILKIINILFFIIIILAILLTGARAAFLGFCCGLLILTFSQNKKIWITAICCCLLGYLVITNYTEYFSFFNRTDDYNSSFEIRDKIWKEGWKIFLNNPIVGIGIGNHHNYILHHSMDGYYIIDNEVVFYGAESGYLQILIEFGLSGFLIFLLLIIKPIINAIQLRNVLKDFNIYFLIAPIISWMVAYTTVNSLGDKRILVILITFLSLLTFSKRLAKTSYA
jgi:O-antigen ligase